MATNEWSLVVIGIIVMSVMIAFFIGKTRESAKVNELIETLSQSIPSRTTTNIVDFDSFSELPPPVSRYFRYVLTDGQKIISMPRMHQSGVLRSSTREEKWSTFTAEELVSPPATGFIWNAKVMTPLSTHLRVLDSYTIGIGSGRVSFLSAFNIASEHVSEELNSGALHRYLAESVWFPTALLPQSGVIWSPINDHSAMATITDRGTTVSLEFRFNETGEVMSIYSPGRFGIFDGEFKKVPWEGHFRDYQLRAGMRIPLYGEVGWYVDGVLQLVWKGNIIDVQYEFEQ